MEVKVAAVKTVQLFTKGPFTHYLCSTGSPSDITSLSMEKSTPEPLSHK